MSRPRLGVGLAWRVRKAPGMVSRDPPNAGSATETAPIDSSARITLIRRRAMGARTVAVTLRAARVRLQDDASEEASERENEWRPWAMRVLDRYAVDVRSAVKQAADDERSAELAEAVRAFEAELVAAYRVVEGDSPSR